MAITFDGARREVSSKFRDSARMVQAWQGLAVSDGKIVCLGDIHAYASASCNYAAAWLYGPGDDSPMGFGRATGYGYNRKGAAIRAAFGNAGIVGAPNAEASEREAIRAVFEAVALARGLDPETVYVAESNA